MGPLYGSALRRGDPLEAVYPDGRRMPVPVDSWRGPLVPGDRSILDRCVGPTLDVGCGPGRITAALQDHGLSVLGIDTDDTAVRLARDAGALAVHCDVFGHVPCAGRWSTVLLVDGNIGIGGAPLVLLRRVAALSTPEGRLLVEVEGPSKRSSLVELRLATGARVSAPFRWARLAVHDAGAVAALAGLRVEQLWEEADRWFVALRAG
ncbi:MAG: methyltransferase domain-containing protein [Sporichthyaceae bacterium]|nr:methyltransferase domain-containing protein [Sporichthyaceae bacterium]